MRSMAFRPFGIMFQVTGTAATQYSRVAADATGAANKAAAPVNTPATNVAFRISR
jgi:hypothetical protein